MAAVQEELAGTYGALLLGGLFSACLTGVVVVQTLLYFKLFPFDRLLPKLLVSIIWFVVVTGWGRHATYDPSSLLDMLHSGMVWTGIWVHLITRPRNLADIDYIPLTVSLSIVVTAFLTFLVHMFFADRIHRLSNGKWLLTLSIVLIAGARLGFACAAQMIRLESFRKFVEVSSWSFTLGLALSSAVDVIVTASLFFLLKDTCGADTLRLGQIIDSLVLYTIEIGSVTCVFTVVSMICWLTMRHNLIFLGLHFIIGKLYANSLLATLNTRRTLRISQRRLNDVDASRIVREDLRFHFPTSQLSTMNTTLEAPNLAAAIPSPVFASGKEDYSTRTLNTMTEIG